MGVSPRRFDAPCCPSFWRGVAYPSRSPETQVDVEQQRGRGHLVTIGSVSDHVAFPGSAAYAASKYGVRGLHEVIAEELKGTGVRTTLLSPGPVDTKLWDEVDPDSKPGFTKRAAMLQPSDVADAVLFAVTRPPRVSVDEISLIPAAYTPRD